ncbi:MAG: response regulator [Lysobacterales bacterium]|jgi:CheY-like chemotaxis protein
MAETKRQILVADDHEINRTLFKGLLEHRGYGVTLVEDGSEVLPALRASAFDLVVLDCMMPGMDGFETAQAIRRHRGGDFNANIPILATTALATDGNRRKCLAAGMNAYLAKPIRARALYDQIDTLLENSGVDAGERESTSPAPIETVLDSMSDDIQREFSEWQLILSELVDRGAWREIGSLAHKIRGMSDLLGAREVSALAAELEAAAGKVSGARAGELTRRLIAALASRAGDLDSER